MCFYSLYDYIYNANYIICLGGIFIIEFLSSYITNIAIFLILVAVFEMILPENSYSKYIRVFIGFILMINVIMPFENLKFNVSFDEFKIDDKEVVSNIDEGFVHFLEKSVKGDIKALVKRKTNQNVVHIDIEFLEVSQTDFYIENINIYIKEIENINKNSYKNQIIKLLKEEYFNHINNIFIEYIT